MTADYGATFPGVNGFLQWDLAAADTPSVDDVDRFMAVAAAEINAAIGSITGMVDETDFKARAAHLVHLYAAATSQEVAYPEVAGDKESYANVLWARYLLGLQRLVADVEEERTTGGTVAGATTASHGFPAEALVKRDMGF
jgi:hypothetical protein